MTSEYQQYLTALQQHKTKLILIPQNGHFITFADDAVLAAAHCNLVPRLIDRCITTHLKPQHVDQLKANEVQVHIVQAVAEKQLTIDTLIAWLNAELEPHGETAGPDFSHNVVVMTGEAGQEYSEYSNGLYYLSFEGSVMYDLLAGSYGWAFHTRLHHWLAQYGCYSEHGHAWNLNIYTTEASDA